MSDEELESAILGIEQKLREKISNLSFLLGETEKHILESVPDLMSQTVSNTVIDRLKDSPDIADWVEQGLRLREKYEGDLCEFCGQHLPETRVKALLEHFNDADRKLKDRLDSAISCLRNIHSRINDIACPDRARLYEDLTDKYSEEAQAFTQAKADLLDSISTLSNALKEKKAHTTENYGNFSVPDFTAFMAAISAVNAVIEKHNQITDEFDARKKKNEGKIRNHYLAEIRPKEINLSSKITALEAEISNIENDENKDSIKVLTDRITQNRARISTAEASCDKLNETLCNFLGRDEIKFTPSEDDNSSYSIMRSGKKAKKLSDGEKTALAFVFFHHKSAERRCR